jgi:hypothetical protein
MDAQIECKTVGKEMQLVIGRRDGAEPRGETNGTSH